MTDSKRYIPNPIAGFRKVVDTEITKHFNTREELKKTSQLLLAIVGLASAYLAAQMAKNGFAIKDNWFPITILSVFAYVIWRMHIAWISGTIREMAGDDDSTSENIEKAASDDT